MTNQRTFLLGDAHIEPLRGIIRVGTDERYIEPQNMAVLMHLCQHPGQVVTRDALLDAAWEGCIVNDGAVSKAICLLRKALGDKARHPRYIQTIPKVGYRLIASIDVNQPPPAAGSDVRGNTSRHAHEDRPPVNKRTFSQRAQIAAQYLALVVMLGFLYTQRPTTIEIEQDVTYFPSGQQGGIVVDSSRTSVDGMLVEEEVLIYHVSSVASPAGIP